MFRLIFVLVFTIFFMSCSEQTRLNDSEKLARFFQKKSVRLVVTDSGLGGLSVFADLAARISGSGLFENVEVSYFNAQLDSSTGYNDMKTMDQKVRIFENALNAMEKNFSPDMILIACNTLSVVYPGTKFAATTNIPVIGIVGTGVELIQDRLRQNDSSKVIIFATLTTVEQNAHKKMLVAGGVDSGRIVTQACPRLAGSIERGAASQQTRELVNEYVDQALEKIPGEKMPVIISFNCTHYGYVGDLFADCLTEQGQAYTELLDPNTRMIDFMFTEPYLHRYPETSLSLKVVSQPELSEARINSIGSLIAAKSPAAYDALKRYTYAPDFFEWQSIAQGQRD